MSSPPTPNTSIRVASLCKSRPKVREKSSSYPSIATLNLFHKKPPPQPSSPVEPYEVAPGIWSTDATARVFGYLDTNDKGAELRAQSTGPDIQTPGQKAKRKPVPVRDPLGEFKQARFVDGTKQYNTDRLREESDTAIQSRLKERVKKGIKTKSDWFGAKQDKMRTVSRDDQLVERGANPRTGLVSPFVVSDNSEERLGGDYIAVDEVGSAGPSLGRRTRSGKWKQDSLGWSLVESPLLNPVAQSMNDKISRTVSTKQLEERLLVERPGMDKSDPRSMTDELKKYQERIARAYKRGGGSIAMLDPDTLPFPRQWTPEGPGTPPTKLSKIQRKEVGSSMVRKSDSCDTVIVNANNGAPSLSTQRKDIIERQKVRIITPSNTPKGSSFESCATVSSAMGKADPFLGRELRTTRSQTLSATPSQYYLNTGQAHQSHQNKSESSPSSTISDPLAASQTLSQYLPHLEFLHPSHFANLETSSYRHPPQLQLRLLGQQTRAVEDACTTTFTTTSTKQQRWEQRPQMHRQGGNDVVPRVNYLSSGYEKRLGGYRQVSTPRNKQFYPNDIPVDTLRTSDLVTGKSPALGPTEKANPVEPLARTRYQRKPQLPAECLRQPPCENRPRYLASPTHTTHGPSLGGAKVARRRIQRKQSGDGCTPTYEDPGSNEPRAVPAGRMQYISNDKEQANLPAELTIGGDMRAWCTGEWAEVPEEGEGADLPTSMQEETFARRRLVLRGATGVNLWLDEPLTRLRPIQQFLCRMICHLRRTLHHTSLALDTLRMANATTRDHLRAMKDLVFAALHLLVLLKSLMILRGVLVFVCKVLYCVWHLIQATLRIIGWCVVG